MFIRKAILKKVFSLVVSFIFLFTQTVWAVQMVCYMPNGPIRSTPQYNPQTGFCETWPLDEYNTCPERYIYNQWLGTCVDLPRCTGDYVYDPGTKSCIPIGNQTQEGSGTNGTTQYDNICAIDLNGDGEITEDELAQCITADDGSKICPLDAAPCQAKYVTPDCPSGYTYDSQTKTCQSNPTCVPGFTYDSVNKVCTKQVECPNGGTLQNINGQWKCVATGNSTCPSGYTTDPTRGVCLAAPSDWKLRCPSGWKFYKQIYDSSKYGCPISLTINGETWTGFEQHRWNSACDPNSWGCTCYSEIDGSCCGYGYTACYYSTAGYYRIPASDINNCTYNTCQPYFCYNYCFEYGQCMYKNVCVYPEYFGDEDDDGLYFMGPKKGDPICSQGQYPNSQTGMCEFCPSGYTYDTSLKLCVANISCPSGSTFDTNLQACVTSPSCISGGSFNQNIGKCEGSASCPSGATLTDNGCLMGYFCPYGDYPCKPVNGVMMCSANQCLTTSQEQALEEDDPDEPSDYKDDGQTDSAGQCLGQIYIFNGEKQRCRPSGWKTMFKNCCSSSLAKEKIYDSTGSTGANFALLRYSAEAIKYAYDIVNFGYWFARGSTYVKVGQDVFVLSKSADFSNAWIVYKSSTEGQALQNFLSQEGFSVSPDSTVEVFGGDQAVADAMKSYVDVLGPAITTTIVHFAISGLIKDPQLQALVNVAADAVFYAIGWLGPGGFAIAVIGAIISFLFGGGCDKEDIITVTKRVSGRCHYVGERCIKKLRLGPIKKCIQKAKYYCCFNSKLARIIHEQGRPQLNTDIRSWGSAKHPNCRGFTPEEFASLDFDKIDLSEYYADITRNIPNNIETNVQEFFYGSIQKQTSR